MSENVEGPPEKRQPLARLENENLDCLLDAVQVQSTKFSTAYSVFVYESKRFYFYFGKIKSCMEFLFRMLDSLLN